MQNNQYGNYGSTNNSQEVSFRGDTIPSIRTQQAPVDITPIDQVLSSINMNSRESGLKIEAVRYDDEGIDLLKLNTGDVITLETAIALAEEEKLPGYTTGATVKGGRTLRSIPSNDYSIHELPLF